MSSRILTESQVAAFHQDGYLVCPKFYDLVNEIEPIQAAIYQIIDLVIKQSQLKIVRQPYVPDQFDDGFNELIRIDRRLGGIVYDAVKQIPAFVRLTASVKHDSVIQQLRGSTLPGCAAAGNGIRIDNPGEDRFRAVWHQDYPYNLRSLDGLVFWSPLVPVVDAMGPLTLARGSHRDGLRRIVTNDPRFANKPGAYQWHLENEAQIVNAYPHDRFETQPGDLVILDYLTLHAGGENRSNRSRWTMQMRYFNFLESQGRSMDWTGGVNAGRQLKDIHPELVVEHP